MLERNQETITFRIPEASAYLGISDYLLRKLAREKKIAHIRAGKLLLFRQASLDAYLLEAEQASLRRDPSGVNKLRAVAM